MSTEMIIALLNLIPSILWIVVLIALLVIFYKPIRRDILPKMTGVKAFGMFEASFAKDQLEKVGKSEEKPISHAAQTQVLRRLEFDAPMLRGTQLLWIDDEPDNNIEVRRLLRSYGVLFDLAISSEEAIIMHPRRDYDLVISDMSRHGVLDEGLRFLTSLQAQGRRYPFIFYVGRVNPDRPIPRGAAGITSRPDQLITLVLNELEKARLD